jgi:hypothetical protein
MISSTNRKSSATVPNSSVLTRRCMNRWRAKHRLIGRASTRRIALATISAPTVAVVARSALRLKSLSATALVRAIM